MKEQGVIYKPTEVETLYREIVSVYQNAFSGEPWFEVCKCEDTSEPQRCVGGFSPLPIGKVCKVCDNRLSRPAYEVNELTQHFRQIAQAYPTAWYLEQNENEITLAAFACKVSHKELVQEKYLDVPEMFPWTQGCLGSTEFIWLDEVFANKEKSRSGNLVNFGSMCRGFADHLQNFTICYRTINEKMVAVAERDFPEQSTVFKREVEIPDRRDFVVINLNQ